MRLVYVSTKKVTDNEKSLVTWNLATGPVSERMLTNWVDARREASANQWCTNELCRVCAAKNWTENINKVPFPFHN